MKVADSSLSPQCPDCGANGGGHYFYCKTHASYVQPMRDVSVWWWLRARYRRWRRTR